MSVLFTGMNGAKGLAVSARTHTVDDFNDRQTHTLNSNLIESLPKLYNNYTVLLRKNKKYNTPNMKGPTLKLVLFQQQDC